MNLTNVKKRTGSNWDPSNLVYYDRGDLVSDVTVISIFLVGQTQNAIQNLSSQVAVTTTRIRRRSKYARALHYAPVTSIHKKYYDDCGPTGVERNSPKKQWWPRSF